MVGETVDNEVIGATVELVEAGTEGAQPMPAEPRTNPKMTASAANGDQMLREAPLLIAAIASPRDDTCRSVVSPDGATTSDVSAFMLRPPSTPVRQGPDCA